MLHIIGKDCNSEQDKAFDEIRILKDHLRCKYKNYSDDEIDEII